MKKLIFASFLFILMLLPYSSLGGTFPTIPPVNPGCCQNSNAQGQFMCTNSDGFLCEDFPNFEFDGFFPGETCNEHTGRCSGFETARNVPTLGEWGLIAMAGVMGIIGFMILRKRKAEV